MISRLPNLERYTERGLLPNHRKSMDNMAGKQHSKVIFPLEAYNVWTYVLPENC